MISIDDKTYWFDMNRICEFVNYSDKTENKETEILDTYQEGKVISKSVRELTTPGNIQMDTFKYDIVKTFVMEILEYEVSDVMSLEEAPIGVKIAVNTLIKYGILIEQEN